MHVLILNFNLKDMTVDQWVDGEAPRLAPMFSHLPGLMAKLWLADSGTSACGGIYLWRDRDTMERFLGSDLAVEVRAHPNITNVTARCFEVMEVPTRLTQPELEVIRPAQLASPEVADTHDSA